MSNDGFYTDESNAFSGKVNSIPLSDADSTKAGETSIGQLVSNATEQMSTLIRSEIELAKTEITGEVKKGAVGGGFFAAAGVIALFSSFFLFFFIAELLAVWLARWAAFLIVFVAMIAVAGLLAFLGVKKFKKIRSPQATISSVSDMKDLVPGKATKNVSGKDEPLYT